MTTQYNYERYKWYVLCGKEGGDFFGNQPTSSTARSDYPTEHREKPSPLTLTSRHLITNTTYSYGRSERVTYDSTFCNGVLTPRALENHRIRVESIPSVAFERMEFDSARWNNQYLATVRGLSADASGLVAEIDETAKMITDMAKIVSDVSLCLSNPFKCKRTLKHLKAFYTWKAIPSAVLLNNFAIQPTVSALNDIVTRLKDEEYSLYREAEFRMVQKDFTSGTYWNCRKRLVTKTKLSIKLKDNGFLTRVNLGNPLEWAWERIPFSFVVDWVLPVGNFVQAVGTLNTIEFSHGTRTQKHRMIATGTDSSESAIGYKLTTGFNSQMNTYERQVVGGPSMPAIKPVKSKSLTRLASAVSLLSLLRAK